MSGNVYAVTPRSCQEAKMTDHYDGGVTAGNGYANFEYGSPYSGSYSQGMMPQGMYPSFGAYGQSSPLTGSHGGHIMDISTQGQHVADPFGYSGHGHVQRPFGIPNAIGNTIMGMNSFPAHTLGFTVQVLLEVMAILSLVVMEVELNLLWVLMQTLDLLEVEQAPSQAIYLSEVMDLFMEAIAHLEDPLMEAVIPLEGTIMAVGQAACLLQQRHKAIQAHVLDFLDDQIKLACQKSETEERKWGKWDLQTRQKSTATKLMFMTKSSLSEERNGRTKVGSTDAPEVNGNKTNVYDKILTYKSNAKLPGSIRDSLP
ncbi:LOW QUALITY PROTEIN: hypothetical protein M514_06317 [Trichuris suis]|uniref:Uncharacterized protein n=1 Tax=Trichuris suis TaxID=68888 RepID=A0A085N634_9BILA|nr:LOW QUALITY PROTEIN: hypothetical protein M514_06317 [Trichuris suis]